MWPEEGLGKSKSRGLDLRESRGNQKLGKDRPASDGYGRIQPAKEGLSGRTKARPRNAQLPPPTPPKNTKKTKNNKKKTLTPKKPKSTNI